MPLSRAVRAAVARGTHARRVRRPGPPEFELAYLRSGTPDAPVLLIIPGGPGLASSLPYLGFRRRAVAEGFRVLMVEHRGIGLSRTDLAGRDLPLSALHTSAVVDDLAAVLDAEQVAEVTIVGASYGSYLAAAFGARYPERVSAMLLDSPMLGADDHVLERIAVRDALWEGRTPDGRGPDLSGLARRIRSLTERSLTERGLTDREILDVVRLVHEFAGPRVAEQLVGLRARGRRRSWDVLARRFSRTATSLRPVTCVNEFDLAGAIGFRELRYAPAPDGLPLDPALTYAELAPHFPAFSGAAFDLPAAMPAFDWPTVLLSGQRDLRTPPALAATVHELIPGSVLVSFDNGHSALETRPDAVLHCLTRLRDGRWQELPADSARLDALPAAGFLTAFRAALHAGIRAESLRR